MTTQNESTSNETHTQRALGEGRATFAQAIEEAKSLQVTERILSSIEQAMMGRVHAPYDTEAAIEAARALNQALCDESLVRIREAEDRFTDALYLWRSANATSR